MQNLLDYNINKHMRNLSNRPVIKMGFLGCCGEEADGIKYYTSVVEGLTREVKHFNFSTLLLLFSNLICNIFNQTFFGCFRYLRRNRG
jgi:hypothetical protein